MKKTAAMLISGVLMLSLCACGGTAEPDPVPTGNSGADNIHKGRWQTQNGGDL